jgi:hypothetical protein
MSFSIAHLHASDWRNASGAMPPAARIFHAYFASVLPPISDSHAGRRSAIPTTVWSEAVFGERTTAILTTDNRPKA